jgi:hypothetical protein
MRPLRALAFAAGGLFAALAACGDEPAEDDQGSGATGPGPTSAQSASASASSSSGTGGCGPTTNLGLSCADEYTNVTGACDLLAQDCATGEYCDIDAEGASVCLPDHGGVKCRGESCVTLEECQAGLQCIDSKCTPFCCPDSNEPCAGGLCDTQVDFGNDMFGLVCSYLPQCQLLMNECTAPAECHPARFDQALAVCDSPSSSHVGEGESCIFRNDCGESQICNTTGEPGVCRQLCNVRDWMTLEPPTGGCPPERECVEVDWGNDEWTHIGICLTIGVP